MTSGTGADYLHVIYRIHRTKSRRTMASLADIRGIGMSCGFALCSDAVVAIDTSAKYLIMIDSKSGRPANKR